MTSFINRLAITLAALMTIASPLASAALPRPDTPTRGQGSGLLQLVQNYFFDGITLAGLVLAAICFFIVAMNAVKKFHEVTDKKATWTDFFTLVGVGAVLLIIVIWLINKAVEIL